MDHLDFLDTELQTLTMTDVVFRKLEKAILEGHFKNGEILSTEAIRKKLNVSRMPVREAFRKLEAEELVQIHPQRGVVVAPISVRDFEELKDTRLVLEKHAFALVIDRASDDELSALEQYIWKENDEGDWHRVLNIRNEFHYAVHHLSGNRVLVSYLRRIFAKFTRYIYLYAQSIGAWHQQDFGDSELLTVLKSRDKQAALSMLQKHVDFVAERIFSLLAEAGL